MKIKMRRQLKNDINHKSKTERQYAPDHGRKGGRKTEIQTGNITFICVCLDGDGPDGNEENASDEVDEELQDGEVGAQQVGYQHCRSDNRKPRKSKLRIYIEHIRPSREKKTLIRLSR